ncbi:MAG TPA: DUF4129 domain-containing protein [Thermoplasmata archaeon]|nr:DUF4129 domain-containing protein [Thermoplasmata archaeon]
MADRGELVVARRSPAILMIPLLAIAFGAAAVLLTGGVSVGPAGTPVGGSGPGLLGGVTYEEAGFFAVALIGAWVLWSAYQRVRGNALSLPVHFVASALTAFAVAIAFIAIVHLFVHGAISSGSPPVSGTSGGGNGSSPRTPPQPENTTGGTGPPGAFPLPSSWPWWVPYAVLAALGVGIGALAVPFALSRALRSEKVPISDRATSAASALGAALTALEAYQGDDPRPTILRLYAELLRAVGPRAGPIDPMTPREISQELVAGLGVTRAIAQELTDRFEEARYSRRPLGPDAVARTRRALSQALDELARPGRLP